MDRINHLIDPSFFYEAIEEFAFNYTIYIVAGITLDERGLEHNKYEKQIIRGSLQSKGSSLTQSKDGNKMTHDYDFYSKSLYQFNIGDVIEYNGQFYMFTSVQDYDEFGVREGSLSMIQLTNNRDLNDYVNYLKGVKRL